MGLLKTVILALLNKSMVQRFLISDTHFAHDSVYKFTDKNGDLIRPWASNAEEGDAIMVENWNKVVKPNDKVYHLGDVAMRRKGLKVLALLNGKKVLIRGNHDIFKLKDYTEYFEQIHGLIKVKATYLSHVPLHPNCLPVWCKLNVHGHLHSNVIEDDEGTPDPRYRNICVEHTNATPIPFEEVIL